MSDSDISISARRLRIAVIFLFLFWIPVWLAVPSIAVLFHIDSSAGEKRLLAVILLIQTIFGLLGLLLAGKEVIKIMREVPKKRVPGTVWHAVLHGNLDVKNQSDK